jgi:hypothetical protein
MKKNDPDYYSKIGQIGGPARAKSLTPTRRREIAIKAAVLGKVVHTQGGQL